VVSIPKFATEEDATENRIYCSFQVSLQCRRILGGRNLVCVRNIAVAAIFDFMTVEDWGE